MTDAAVWVDVADDDADDRWWRLEARLPPEVAAADDADAAEDDAADADEEPEVAADVDATSTQGSSRLRRLLDLTELRWLPENDL